MNKTTKLFFGLIFLATAFFLTSNEVIAGDEACTVPGYPTCYSTRVINEWVCTSPEYTQSYCTEGGVIKGGGGCANQEDPTSYCQAIDSGSTCETWWFLSGSWTQELNLCESTGTTIVSCNTSDGICSVNIANYKECSTQSSSGTCSLTTVTKPYSCCGGDSPPGDTTSCVVGSTSCKTNCTENEKGGGSCPGGCPAGQYCCEVLSCSSGGPTCIPSSGSPDPGASCNYEGFYGRTYYGNTTLPVARGYSCNPYSSPIGGEVCNYWDNQWTGYLNLDEGGDYEFWISYQPALKFQIDVNQNGVFDQVCGSITTGDVGDNFLFISGSCNTKYRYSYLDTWSVTSGATGNSCWENYDLRIACDVGRHCQNADYRTTAVNTYPTIVTPLPSGQIGSSECPIAALNSEFPEQTEWGEKGTGHSYFTRTLSTGSTLIDMRYTAHRGDQTNNQVLGFKYRKVGSSTWIDLANSATYGGVCPISPCVVEPPVPLVSWWQVKDSDLITNGDITSDVPVGNIFSDDGAGGYPGVTVFGGTLDYGAGTLSSTDWNANTTYSSLKVYNYSTFARQFPEEVVAGASVITDPVIDQTILTSGGYLDSRGYYWYIYSGINDPVISGNINLADRKVILLIPGKDLSIEGNIALTDGVGFLALFVGIDTDSNGGDITVSGDVTTLEGIYLSDGIFSTGSLGAGADSQFHTRGAVAALGGVTMQRDLADNTSPAELWEYGADQIMLLMANPSIAIRKMSWKEVAP